MHLLKLGDKFNRLILLPVNFNFLQSCIVQTFFKIYTRLKNINSRLSSEFGIINFRIKFIVFKSFAFLLRCISSLIRIVSSQSYYKILIVDAMFAGVSLKGVWIVKTNLNSTGVVGEADSFDFVAGILPIFDIKFIFKKC